MALRREGIVLLCDKPAGITSHDMVQAVRRERECKAGHAGTLDPFATGLLLVLLDGATRLQRFFTGLPKTYLTQARLGWRAGITARRTLSGNVRVVVQLRQRNGDPQTQASLTGEMRHPADENRDRPLRFSEMSPGIYEAELTGLAPGNWDVLVSNQGHDPFQASRRLWLP